MSKRKRRQFFANKMHRELFLLVLFAALLPAIITGVSLYYLIFNITADQLGIPEAIASSIIPAAQQVISITAIATPILVLIILILAHKITHKVVGPFDRVIRELDECIEGSKQGHIILRKGDKFLPLVERINALLNKLKKN